MRGLRTVIDGSTRSADGASMAPALAVVDGIDFSLYPGETFAIVGESGCGKSITALSLMRLLPDAARVVAGQVLLQGEDLLALGRAHEFFFLGMGQKPGFYQNGWHRGSV